MDFKYINDKSKTPNAKCSSTMSCDSPFRFLPSNCSTPPSRCAKIFNPFDSHYLIERLHLPTASPSVFAAVSTPKTTEKFKWSIEDISNLKPADIDEQTISQHVFVEDPQTEFLVQQKIERFFSEKAIVPSPMTDIVRVPLISEVDIAKDEHSKDAKYCTDNSAQTILTLPPVLPEELENLLKPYFTYTEDQQQAASIKIEDTSLYHNLFESKTPQSDKLTPESSPALSTGFSPIESPFAQHLDNRESIISNLSVLSECNLSPISVGKSSPKETSSSRSVCRLNFSAAGMSVDASMIVPNIDDGQLNNQTVFSEQKSPQQSLSDSTVNWEMEYQNVSLVSPSSNHEMDRMDISNSNTPHSRIFTSQRKRLSDSFKNEENDIKTEDDFKITSIRQTRKLFRNDMTDAGYHTGSDIYFNDSLPAPQVFASTPTKHQKY